VLEAQLKAVRLIPGRPLDLDTQAAVHYEWLIAHGAGRFSATAWIGNNEWLLSHGSRLPSSLWATFETVRSPEHIGSVFPIIRFPEMVLLASMLVVTGAQRAYGGANVLRELLPVCPGIVTRCLILASALAHLQH
jgi:hypothetical protein